MQVVAGIVLPWVHNLGKASDELFHRAAPALDCTQRFQPCPLRRNACVQAPAPYAIALGPLAEALDAVEDLVDGLGPDEGARVGVGGLDVAPDRLFQGVGAAEDAASELAAGEQGEPCLDEVEPRR